RFVRSGAGNERTQGRATPEADGPARHLRFRRRFSIGGRRTLPSMAVIATRATRTAGQAIDSRGSDIEASKQGEAPASCGPAGKEPTDAHAQGSAVFRIYACGGNAKPGSAAPSRRSGPPTGCLSRRRGKQPIPSQGRE